MTNSAASTGPGRPPAPSATTSTSQSPQAMTSARSSSRLPAASRAVRVTKGGGSAGLMRSVPRPLHAVPELRWPRQRRRRHLDVVLRGEVLQLTRVVGPLALGRLELLGLRVAQLRLQLLDERVEGGREVGGLVRA